MPKLLAADMQASAIPGLSGYSFSGVRTDRLGAAEYTLVTIACDTSTSIGPFRDLLVECVKKAVGGCRKSPRANNILVRVIGFATSVTEIHGFKPLSEIDDSDYDAIQAHGNTALYDAAASGIGAMAEYGRQLARQDFAVNGIAFIITDGSNNSGKYSAAEVRAKIAEALQEEVLESLVTVLVGINAAAYKDAHLAFVRDAGLTAYEDAGDATPGNLAKLAGFVSRSVSSQASAGASGAAAGGIAI